MTSSASLPATASDDQDSACQRNAGKALRAAAVSKQRALPSLTMTAPAQARSVRLSSRGSTVGTPGASSSGQRPQGAPHPQALEDTLCRISLPRSRSQSRFFSVSRLSCAALPLASAISTLTRPPL